MFTIASGLINVIAAEEIRAMIKKAVPRQRSLRIAYYDAETRFAAVSKSSLEHAMSHLGPVDLVTISRVDDSKFEPCDALIVAADHVDEDSFSAWLLALRNKMRKQQKIWTPALILARVGFHQLTDLFADAVEENWYFDIISPEHLESLPIRLANLLRIHDHLHELRRYNQEVEELQSKTDELDRKLQQLSAGQ